MHVMAHRVRQKGAISGGIFTRPKGRLSAASAPLKYEFMMVESE